MRAIAIGTLAIFLVGCGSSSLPPIRMPVISSNSPTESAWGGGVSYHNFLVSGGNRYRTDSTGSGILWGHATVPNGAPQLVYVAVFKYPASYSSMGTVADSGTRSLGDGEITINDGIMLNGQELRIQAELFADAAAGRITREELRVGTESLDVSNGRLIMIDMTQRQPRWQQINVDLRQVLAGVDITNADAMGTTGVERIRQSAPEVDQLLD